MSKDATQASLDTTKLPALPSSWCWTTLSNCSKRITDGTHQPPPFTDAGVPFIFVQHIVSGSIQFANTKYISDQTYNALNNRCPVEVGDILYSAVGSYGVAVPVLTTARFSFQRHIAHIKPYEQFCQEYLVYYLNSPDCVSQAHRVARGVAQKTVTLGSLRQFVLPLAPLNEQRRIVAKIEELFSDLDAGVAALERAKAKLKRYRAAVLKAAVEGKLTKEWRKKNRPKESGQQLLDRILRERRRKWEEEQLAAYAKAGKKPPANWKEKYKEPAGPDDANLPALPEGWCWATLESVAQIEGGITKDQKRSQTPGMRDVPYLRVANVQRGFLDLTEMKTILADEEEIESLRLQKDDILFTEGGDRDKLGRGWVWNSEIEECIHQNHIFRARLFSRLVQSRFVSYHGNYFGQKWFVRTGKQTTNLASINKGVLSRFPIPIAPAEEQKVIVNEADQRLSLIQEAENQIDADLKRSARLRQSILKRAFEGKLVPQDAKDESANVLLERIKVEQDGKSVGGKHKVRVATKAGRRG